MKSTFVSFDNKRNIAVKNIYSRFFSPAFQKSSTEDVSESQPGCHLIFKCVEWLSAEFYLISLDKIQWWLHNVFA